MASIQLRVKEADGYLPEVCMCCGEAATATKVRKMQWTPPWVGILILAGLLPYVIIAMILTKRTTIQAPFCDRHQSHWLNRALLMWGSFFLFGAIGLAGVIVAANLPNPERDAVFPFVCVGGSLLLLVWLVIVVVCQNTVIRPSEITEDTITLTGVSDNFVNAVEDARDERRARKRERERQSWRDEDDEEEEQPRRRRGPSSDAIEE